MLWNKCRADQRWLGAAVALQSVTQLDSVTAFFHFFLISHSPLRPFWIPLLSLLLRSSFASFFSLLVSSPCIHTLLFLPPFFCSFFPWSCQTADPLPCKTEMQAILSEGCRDCCCKVYRHTGGSKGFKRAANAHTEPLHHWAHLLTQPSPCLQDD